MPTRRPRSPGRGSTSTRDGRVVGPLAPGQRSGRVDGPGGRVRADLDGAGAGSRAARRILGVRAWPVADAVIAVLEVDGERSLVVRPDVGTAAWIDCAGHLPWGLSGDQREDDAHSLTWEWRTPSRCSSVSRRVRLRLGVRPAASLSVKLCDVFPDGTSALITRGTLDLAFRDGPTPAPLVPDEKYDVSCCSTRAPTGRIPATGSGSRWPARTGRTPSPPRLRSRSPCTEARSTLPLWADSGVDPPAFVAGRRVFDRGRRRTSPGRSP